MNVARFDGPHGRSVEGPGGIEQGIAAGLDRQRVGSGPDSWLAYVTGVHVDGATVWIQIAKSEGADESIIVRMPRNAAASDVLAALTNVRVDGDASPIMIVVGS